MISGKVETKIVYDTNGKVGYFSANAKKCDTKKLQADESYSCSVHPNGRGRINFYANEILPDKPSGGYLNIVTAEIGLNGFDLLSTCILKVATADKNKFVLLNGREARFTTDFNHGDFLKTGEFPAHAKSFDEYEGGDVELLQAALVQFRKRADIYGQLSKTVLYAEAMHITACHAAAQELPNNSPSLEEAKAYIQTCHVNDLMRIKDPELSVG